MLLSLIGPLSLLVMFFVLGLLSRRIGKVTRTRPHYLWFLVAALLISFSFMFRFVFYDAALQFGLSPDLIYSGLMAIALTLALMVAWRYWSWLLAERN